MTLSAYAVVIAMLMTPTSATATTLINDPAHPLTGLQLRSMRHWLNRSAEPTPPIIRVHRGECPSAVACANVDRDPRGNWFVDVGSMWIRGDIARHDRFAFMHEVGHIVDAELYTPGMRRRIKRLLDMVGQWEPDARFDPETTPPFERAADAYAMCAIHRRWPGRWWHFQVRRHGMVIGGGNPTPYNFRAGPKRYARICSTIRNGLTR
jgi:hypothetical protein